MRSPAVFFSDFLLKELLVINQIPLNEERAPHVKIKAQRQNARQHEHGHPFKPQGLVNAVPRILLQQRRFYKLGLKSTRNSSISSLPASVRTKASASVRLPTWAILIL